MFAVSEVLVEAPITDKIMQSTMTPREKEQFMNFISYFTPDEIEELRSIL